MEKRLDKINSHLSIYQYTEGFAYGTDAVLVAAFARVKKGQTGADLGTGTGIIPILLTHHKNPAKIFAFEIQKDYADLARENVLLCNFSDKIEVICDDVKNITPAYIKEYGFEALDFVVTNPPYMKMTSGALGESERKTCARHEKYCDIFDIARAASNLLKNGGDMYIIYRTERLCDLFCALRENSLEPKELIFVRSFEKEEPKLIMCRARKGASSSLKVSDFVIYESVGKNTPLMDEVYKNGRIGEVHGKRN